MHRTRPAVEGCHPRAALARRRPVATKQLLGEEAGKLIVTGLHGKGVGLSARRASEKASRQR